jgi:putative copper resistance protein D
MGLSVGWDIAFALAILGLAGWYRRASGQISWGRRIIFYSSLVIAGMVLVGPLPHKATTNFTFHMVQHITLMMLVAPLFVLGSPLRALLGDREFPSRSPLRFIFKPEVGFIATHFSPLANAGMRNPNIHSLELILFVVAGVIYYIPVMEGNPVPFHVPYSTRVLSLFAMMLPETMTGFFLYSGTRVLHSLPDSVSMEMGLNEQHAGGAIMWAMGMGIDTIWIVLAARDWFANEAKLAEEEDE